MTLITDRLQAAIDELDEPRHAYDVGVKRGMVDAMLIVIEAEKELERRICQVWKHEGGTWVEPMKRRWP